jgi:hypothetical protein
MKRNYFVIALMLMTACAHKQDFRHYKDDMGYELIGTDFEKVRQTIFHGLKDVKTCYEAGLTNQPDMGGRLVMVWKIDERGNPSDVVVKSSKLKSTGVESCVTTVIKKLKFSELPRGDVAEITYPFFFK